MNITTAMVGFLSFVGMKRSVPYIESKWNIKVGDFKSKNKLDCKTIEGINRNCQVGFARPFNDSIYPLNHWILMPATAARIPTSLPHIKD